MLHNQLTKFLSFKMFVFLSIATYNNEWEKLNLLSSSVSTTWAPLAGPFPIMVNANTVML